MSLEGLHTRGGRLLQELLLELLAAAEGERHVHQRPVLLRDGVVVVPVGVVDGVVEDLRLLLVHLLDSLEAAHLDQLLEHKPRRVHGPARRRVVHGIVLSHERVVEHGGAERVGLADQVLADDHDGHARGSDVLLDAAVDDAVLLHVDGLGQVV